jgi:hypothetical protein
LPESNAVLASGNKIVWPGILGIALTDVVIPVVVAIPAVEAVRVFIVAFEALVVPTVVVLLLEQPTRLNSVKTTIPDNKYIHIL